LNGKDALALFSSGQTVDLVIADHFLSGETGAQVTAEMKRLKPDVPVVILSGAVDRPEGTEHADLFLSKLSTPSELMAALAALLGSVDGARPPRTV
jgi:CheY-like chemotaxis protein